MSPAEYDYLEDLADAMGVEVEDLEESLEGAYRSEERADYDIWDLADAMGVDAEDLADDLGMSETDMWDSLDPYDLDEEDLDELADILDLDVSDLFDLYWGYAPGSHGG